MPHSAKRLGKKKRTIEAKVLSKRITEKRGCEESQMR